MRTFLFGMVFLTLFSTHLNVGAQPGDSQDDQPTVAEVTAGLQAEQGFFTVWPDPKRGKVWLELPPPGEDRVVAELLYVEALVRGLGSNPVGLDRGQLGPARLLRISRHGSRVLFEEPNLTYRALSDEPAEIRATAESFATSVLWGGKIGALDADGRALIEVSDFLIRDTHRVVQTLQATEQGDFALDPSRSAVDYDAILSFPDNTEFQSILTYGSSNPGDLVRSVTPTPEAVTLVQRHAFVRLPDDDYEPRELDPRMGMFGVTFYDYAAPLDQTTRRQWIVRHRLEKTDPDAPRSRAKEPIVYYVDRGAPEPIRSALLDGARWWAEAFEAAGWIDAYQVELLPPDVHPLDVRYNVIQWVHRSTRGWSYGGGVVDPRTGEMIKGHVSLGSLRVRQDRLLFEGLLGTEKTGSGAPDDPIELSLARIRQLSAHEVGHTIGIAHNFAASTYDDRASVMDYPAPLITLGPNGLDTSRAYGVGLGSWDILTVQFGYTDFGDKDEKVELESLVRAGLDKLFLSDPDARPAGAADPRANLWDNFADPVDGLENALAVRRYALDRFGEHNVLPGTALAELEEVLVPVYFHHRFQIIAAAKTVGGVEYHYAVRGDGQDPYEVVDAARQRRAIDVILRLLEPEELDFPDAVLETIPPRPFGIGRNRETFDLDTAPVLDPLGAAATVAGQVASVLFQPERMMRMIDLHRRDPTLPHANELVDRVIDKVSPSTVTDTLRQSEIRRVTERVIADYLIGLGVHGDVPPAVRSAVERGLRQLALRIDQRSQTAQSADGELVGAHAASLRSDIERYFDRDWSSMVVVDHPPTMPPGSPIGMMDHDLGACSFH
ncbi:MAG: zinc-dependent metalloprotease [Acidobacteriota bacterium]